MANEVIQNAGIVTLYGNTNTVIISGDTYTGTAYKQDQITKALSDKQVVAAQDVSLAQFTISAGKNLVGDWIKMSGCTTGAISNNATMTLRKSSLDDNTASQRGGAIANTGMATISETFFDRNSAGQQGGAIYNSGTLTLLQNSISYNRSWVSGGAVYNDGGTATISDSSFNGNTAAAQYGGAIYNNSGMVTISGSTFTENIARLHGGALYNEGTHSQITITESSFVGNTALGFNGGALYNRGAATILGSIFTDNNADGGLGGAICTFDAVAISGSTFSDNTASQTGGAIYNSGTATITASIFTDNTSKEGGAIYNFGTYSQMTIAESTFVGNNAISYGGAISNNKGPVTISDVIFIDNTASKTGGAIFNQDTATIQNSVFSGSKAGISGGAIYNSGTATIKDSVFSGNKAGISGGAIYNSGTATIENCVFTTQNDTIYNSDGFLTFGGTIRTAANISSTNILVAVNGTKLVLDISVYAGTTSKELLSDFDKIFGIAQGNITISINVGNDQAYGKYVLASNALTLDQNVFTVNVNGDATKSFDVSVGETTSYDHKDYTLQLDNGTLSLLVDPRHSGIVTVDGATNTIVIDGVTYTGPAYKQEQIDQALADNMAVAAQDVAYTGTRLSIAKGQKFVGDRISLSGNTTTSDGGALCNQGGTVTLLDSVFSGNQTTDDGGAFFNAGLATVSKSVFSGNQTTDNGGAIYNIGTVMISDSVFATASDTIYSTGDLSFGGTITTAANITSTSAVKVEENTTLVLDLSVYAGTTSKELLTGFDTMFERSQRYLTVSVNVSADQAYGEYVLATGVQTLTQQSFTVVIDHNAQKSFTVSVGGFAIFDSGLYILTQKENVLSLTIKGGNPAGIVTETGATFIVIGETLYEGKSYTADQIVTAFSENAVVAAQGVTLVDVVVASDKKFIGDRVTVSGCTICNSGAVTIRDSFLTAEKDAIYNADGTLTLGGTITTAGNITSTNAVAVEKNTTLVLDLSAYAGRTSKELLTDFDKMFGDSQSDLVISLNVASKQMEGTYILAKGIEELLQTDFTITVDGDAQKCATVSVGGEVILQNKKYKLSLENAMLSLVVTSPSVGIVTKKGSANTVVIDGVTYTGTAYWSENIQRAIDGNELVAAQNVKVSSFSIDDDRRFVGDAVLCSGNSTERYGGAIRNSGIATIIGGKFFDNAAGTFGGAIYNSGTTTISNSSFNDNSAGSFGGAIYNQGGMVVITGSTFTGNTANKAGAIHNDSTGLITIRDSVFIENIGFYGGAISQAGKKGAKLTISSSTFSGNTAKGEGGAIYCNRDVTSCDNVFVGNHSKAAGGAICQANVLSTLTITGDVFFGNSSESFGGAIYCAGIVTISNGLFLGNTARAGGAIISNSNRGTVTITGSTFSGNKAVGRNGGAIANRSVMTITNSTFTGNMAEKKGGAIYNYNGDDDEEEEEEGEESVMTIRDSVFETASDTIYSKGVLTFGGTIKTAANIISTKAITVENNTRLVLDISIYEGRTLKELLTGFDTMFGKSQSDLTISVNVGLDQKDGEYCLAKGIQKISQQNFTILIDDGAAGSVQLTVNGDSEFYNFRCYTLTLNEGTLSLRVNVPGIVTKDGIADSIVIGGVTYSGDRYKESEFDRALVDKRVIVAQNVTLAGAVVSSEQLFIGDTVSMSGNTTAEEGGAICNLGTATISNSVFSGNTAEISGGAIYNFGTATISDSTFTGNTAEISGGAFYNATTATIRDCVFSGNTAAESGGAIYNSGTATIENSVFVTASDTIYNKGALTFGGTIKTAANITSTKAITVENDTQLVLDISAGIPTPALLTGFDTMFGSSQSNLTISVNLDTDRRYGDYVLATEAENLAQQNFTVTIDNSAERSFTISVGGTTTYNYTKYALTLESGTLALHSEKLIDGDTAVVSSSGTITSVVIGGVTYSGEPYHENDIPLAFRDKEIVAAQDVSYAGLLAVTRVFAADTISMSGNTTTEYGGGAIYNIGTTTIVNGVFTGNASPYVGGAIYNIGTTTISNSVFSDNTAAESGGAIYNETDAAILISSGTFSGNRGGAIYNAGTMTIRGGVFATARDTVFNKGALTFGGTIRTAANIFSQKAATVEENTKLILDLSPRAGALTAVISNFYLIFGTSQENLTISIDVAAAQEYGSYVLATNAGTLKQQNFTVTIDGDAQRSFDISIGSEKIYANRKYTLSLVDDGLTLCVEATCDTGVVTKEGTAGSVVIGDVTYTGDAYKESEFAQALVDKKIVAAQGVTLSGFVIGNEQQFAGDAVLFSGNTATESGGAISNTGIAIITGSTFAGNTAGQGGAISNSGTATIGNSVFATVSDTVYNKGALTFCGTIKTAANITSTKTITVEKDTRLVLDISVRTTEMEEVLTDFNTLFGTTQDKLSISINVGSDQECGKYALATNVVTLAQQKITVTLDGDAQKSFAVTVNGNASYYGSKGYTLSVTDGALRLDISEMKDNAIVTFDGGTDRVVIGDVIYYGIAYSQEQIGQALAEQRLIAAQDVTLTGFTVSEEQKFVGENITMSDNAAAIYNKGTMTLAGTITTGANITSMNAITVEKNTTLALDLAARTAEMKELLTDYDTLFSASQNNLSITVNVAQAQSAGAYTLATNADTFSCPLSLNVENEFVGLLDFVTKVVSGERAYRLDWHDQDLQLVVEDVSSGRIFGGDKISTDTEISNATGVEITGGNYVAAAGGVYATNCRVTVNAETSVSVANGNFSSIVCGGSVVGANTVLMVNADSQLMITGGTFANAVAGGNYIASSGGTIYGRRDIKASNTYVNITGGTFLRDVFGGNIAGKNSFVNKGNCYITGSTNITIDTSENIVFIGGNLVAGSSGLGQVVDSSNLTFSGSADNLVFGEKSIVCGDSHGATTAVSCIGNDNRVSRFLTFDGFTGKIDAKVVGFDQVTFVGGSVTLSNLSRMSEVSVWNFFDEAMLTFGNADNSFMGDMLTFDTFTGNEWTVMTGDDSTLVNWDWATSVTIAGQNASFDEQLGYWISTDYKFYREDNALKVAKLGKLA